MKNIVQIGANRGSDDLSELIGETQPNLLVLVEPMIIHNETLKDHYKWVNNLHIENIIITTGESCDLDFFYHLDDGPGFEVATVDINHIIKHYGHGSIDKIVKTQIKALNINELFQNYDLKELDILFIDAEGIDDEIIKSIDFSKIEIQNIYFENLHIKDHNIYKYLSDLGYDIIHRIGSHGWSSLAKK